MSSAEEWIAGLRRMAAEGDDRAVIAGIAHGMLERHYRDRDFLRVTLFSAIENHSLSRNSRLRHAVPLSTFLLEFTDGLQVS